MISGFSDKGANRRNQNLQRINCISIKLKKKQTYGIPYDLVRTASVPYSTQNIFAQTQILKAVAGDSKSKKPMLLALSLHLHRPRKGCSFCHKYSLIQPAPHNHNSRTGSCVATTVFWSLKTQKPIFFLLHPRHAEVQGPGIEPVPELWPWASRELQSRSHFCLLIRVSVMASVSSLCLLVFPTGRSAWGLAPWVCDPKLGLMLRHHGNSSSYPCTCVL